MRVRAGAILIEEKKVVLIERFRAGRHYYTFPGGGVDEGESAEQAAVREMQEETGLQVALIRKVAEVHFRGSLQPYFLVGKVRGVFGSGTGEEFTEAEPDDPETGVYIPVWMPVKELPLHEDVYPVDISRLVVNSMIEGWPQEPVIIFEEPR
jgi:8-oxo-dGTP diphosphatase